MSSFAIFGLNHQFMNDIIHYFSSIPSSHRALILAGGISFFWLIETAVPLFKFNYSKWQHAGINIFFAPLSDATCKNSPKLSEPIIAPPMLIEPRIAN